MAGVTCFGCLVFFVISYYDYLCFWITINTCTSVLSSLFVFRIPLCYHYLQLSCYYVLSILLLCMSTFAPYVDKRTRVQGLGCRSKVF